MENNKNNKKFKFIKKINNANKEFYYLYNPIIGEIRDYDLDMDIYKFVDKRKYYSFQELKQIFKKTKEIIPKVLEEYYNKYGKPKRVYTSGGFEEHLGRLLFIIKQKYLPMINGKYIKEGNLEFRNKMKKALMYLKKAFDLNMKAHDYVGYSQEAYWEDNHGLARYYSDKKWYKYRKKAFYIKKAIETIKENSLPIKYGIDKEEKIIYFHYNGDQISFHYVGDKAPTNKKYKGKWKGEKNLKFPFKI